MRVELLGAINYNKLASYMDKRVDGIVSDNNSILECILGLKEKNLCTPENVQLIDDIIYYLKNHSDGEIAESYIDGLNDIKESFYKSRDDVDKTIKDFEDMINLHNEELKKISSDAVEEVKKLETERRTAVVAAAGNLSHYDGKVFEMLEMIEERALEKNAKLAANICNLGHTSITDHDYCLFAVEDVSILLEQILIEERFSSFTIKSRREVDFSKVGYYVPDFHDKDGNILSNNESLKKDFITYIEWLFGRYSYFIDKGLAKEDARYVLPYNYNSNFFMGFDAHVLADVIIKFTKTRFSLIQEVKEFGERLYEIAKVHIPYIIPQIDQAEVNLNDDVRDFIMDNVEVKPYEIIDKPKLLSAPNDVDDTILIAAIMRKTQMSYEETKAAYEESIRRDPNFRAKLMELIFKNGDMNELAQVSFVFQIPSSYAVLTHYTRHRTHRPLIPEFAPNIDIYQYMTPPAMARDEELLDKYNDVYTYNEIKRNHFKAEGVRDEDLVYFTLSGNMVNIVTSFDGKTLYHIDALRECTRAQWESRNIATGVVSEVKKVEGAELFTQNLGPRCVTHGECKEGKKSCGKVLALQKQKEQTKES